MKINVNSEIGKLKKVLVHRPGYELENLTPDTLERLLFDDIPFLEVAQAEHDEFTDILRSKDVEVYYIEKIVAEAIEQNEAKDEFLKKFVDEAIDTNENITNKEDAKQLLMNYLLEFTNNQELVDKTIAGIRVSEINGSEELVNDNYLFVADALPNLYFQRDPYASIGDGISLNTMYSVTRNRETLYAYIMFKYHPEFKENFDNQWYTRNEEYHVEGGDEIVLNSETLLIGRSERTEFKGIEKLAETLLKADSNDFKQVIAFDIGESRKFMHLDTVFTQVDYNKFSVHPEAINEEMKIWVFKLEDGKIIVKEEEDKIEDVLKDALGLDEVKLILCGDGDPIAAAREQWNDGANTLTIAPGEVVVYSRNPITNKALQREGIKTHIMASAELSRGRGGPRCMSMPLEREELK